MIIMESKIIDALDSVTWYNGLYSPLWKLKDELENCMDESIYCFDDDLNEKYTDGYNPQFEILWMILVLLYGNYGSSPRSGWLYSKNKDNIIKFIDRITKIALESELNS